MDQNDLALTHDEALELLAYLLSSAQGFQFEQPAYNLLRMVSAADHLARAWASRTSGELSEYLNHLALQTPHKAARIDIDLEGFNTYLDEQIRALAQIVKNSGEVEEGKSES